MFPGFDHIYQLRDPVSDRAFRGEVEGNVNCIGLIRGEADPGRTVRIGWGMGGACPGDVIWTTSAHPLILHCRIANLLREQGVKGWRSYPVQVVDKSGEVYDQYEAIGIIGRCDPIDLSRSVVTLKKLPGGWVPQFLGNYFPEQSWDGSDMFMERPDAKTVVTAKIFVTEKTRQVFAEAEVENVMFERLTEIETLTAIYEIGCVTHRLPADFKQKVEAAYRRAGVEKPRRQE
jgi:hypothetical protein